MHGDAPALRVEDLDLEGAEADDDLTSRVGRIGGIPVFPPDGDSAVLVGPHAFPPDHVERFRRQGKQGLAIRVEQVGLPLALEVMVLVRQFEAPAGQPGVEPLDAPDRGSRHEQLAPHGAYPGLDGALLVARIRVAEREREPIVRLERLEQAGQTHLLEPLLAAHARGVVEHDALGHAAEPSEQILERLARALRVLAGHQLARRHVRIRETKHEMMHTFQPAAPIHVDLAEIGLGPAGMPHQVEVPRLAFRGELAPKAGHRPGHCRQRHLRALLVAQPLPHACRGMPPPMPCPAVLGEPLLDRRHVLVDRRRAPLPHGRLGRQVAGLRIFAHGRLARPDLPGYRRDGLAVPSQLANRLNPGHADHLPFRPP